RSPPETSDTKLPPVACDPKTSLASSPDLVNPITDWGNLKRPREVTRCSESGCRKKVGLMGFRCRCGDVFCSEHRGAGRRDSNRRG
ncbi:zinc finger a20 and an1 domain-containing stress-associated protein 5, partial [Phtheirospermum japonicum]